VEECLSTQQIEIEVLVLCSRSSCRDVCNNDSKLSKLLRVGLAGGNIDGFGHYISSINKLPQQLPLSPNNTY
jgi:retron-type reverse transcriptase